MKTNLFLLPALVCLTRAAPIQIEHLHDEIPEHHEEIAHHQSATSYQNLEIEHFYPVPKHFGKEHQHLLEHPIPIGKTITKLEVHHGGKHDHGYAVASVHSDVHGHGHADLAADVGQEEGAGEYQQEEAVLGHGYQVQDQGYYGQS